VKITDIECTVLLVPDYAADATSSAQDNIVVQVHTDEGITGVGETDANPWAVKALIEAPSTHSMGRGLKEMLLGEDPLQPEALWVKLYQGSAMNGRRGLAICALGALDMALWDIWGKAAGKPIWQLLGGAKQTELVPYASLLPEGGTLEQYREGLVAKAKEAVRLGFSAVKAEVCINGPYSHMGLQEKDEHVVEIVAAMREAVGLAVTLMIDVAYAWRDVKQALWVLRQLEPYHIFFMETPLPSDDLDGYARLADATDIRIAAGEWLNSRFEFQDLIDRGRIDVAQPDVGRVGGLTEARRVVDFARDRGRLIVPHCWKTGIGIAASAHLCFAAANAPYFEFLPAPLSESRLRRELTVGDLPLVNGRIQLLDKPGLGIELNPDALQKYQV
jgi:L-alanine-DL-glutamate epimerase-like enolase superfamily enzyme